MSFNLWIAEIQFLDLILAERERERDCLMCSWVEDWVPNIDNILCEKLNYKN